MRIVYVHDALARIGGVERILADKMNYLAEHGYEIYLITSAQGMHPLSFPLSNKVKHIDINVRFHLQYQYAYPKRLWVKWQMNRLFKKKFEQKISELDPDIIIGTTYYKADAICHLKGRVKKIIESHCAKSYTGFNDGPKRNILTQGIYKYTLKKYFHCIEEKSDMIVALTKGDADEWKNANKTSVIPNLTGFISEQSSSCETHRVISVGRLIYQKGFDRLIEAWKMVYSKYPEWKLDIFGEGVLKENLMEQITRYKLNDVIRIYPPTPNILKEFLESSLFVLSSNYEGFGLVLIEAMACGIPCISFDCPYGPKEIIKYKEDGLIIENGEIQKLANGICELIGNESKRKEYGRKAKENVKRFLPEYIMPQWINLFETLIKA